MGSCAAIELFHARLVFKKRIELVNNYKRVTKLTMWIDVLWPGLRCNEEKRPIIDGYAYCRQCNRKVAVHNGNYTSNLIAFSKTITQLFTYAKFTKQKS